MILPRNDSDLESKIKDNGYMFGSKQKCCVSQKRAGACESLERGAGGGSWELTKEWCGLYLRY